MITASILGAASRTPAKNGDMTQGELGRQFGVPFQMVQRWEHGEQLTIERIVGIAVVLKLDSTWLISGQYGIKPELCQALSDTSVRMERAKSASELLDLFKRRDEIRRHQFDPLLGIKPLPMAVGDLLRGLLPAIMPPPASQS